MFCIYCGTTLRHDTKFCAQCGSLRKAESSASEPPPLPARAADVQPSAGQKTPTKWSVPGIAVSVVGALIGRYAGVGMLFPLGCAALVWVILSRLAAERARPVLAAISLQARADALMLAISALVVGGDAFDSVSVDLLLMVSGVVWLYFRPGLGPVMFLTAFQVFAMVMNVDTLLALTIGTVEHKMALAFMALRIAAIHSMITGLRAMRRPALVSALPSSAWTSAA